MKKNIKKIIIIFVALTIFFILLGVVIYQNHKSRNIEAIQKSVIRELKPIKADKVSYYLEPGEKELRSYGSGYGGYDIGSYYFYPVDNRTSIGFWIEKEEGECDENPKIYQKKNGEYVDITPEESKAEIIREDSSLVLFDFSFFSLEKMEEGYYYRIEYGPYIIDFYIAVYFHIVC